MKTGFPPPITGLEQESRTPCPVMIGLGLGRGNGGPYKTLMQFKQALGGTVVSFSDHSTQQIAGDGVVHVMNRKGFLGRSFLWLDGKERKKLDRIVAGASHLQCHILFRYHAHVIWQQSIFRGTPYWVIPHGCLDPYVFSYRRAQKMLWMHFFGRIFLRDAAHVVFATARELRKAQPWLTRHNGRVVRWPTEIPAVGRNPAAAGALRQRLNLPPQSRCLLWLGRIHPMKRPLESATIFSAASPPNAHLIFVGNDEAGLARQLEAETRGSRNVHWLGPLYGKAKDEVIQGCDGYWSYSIRKNFNHAAAECLAASLPVILSPGNDLSEDLADCSPGWLLRSDQADGVARALTEWAVASEDVLAGLGQAGRNWAIAHLSPDRFTENLRALASTTNLSNYDGRTIIDRGWESCLKILTVLAAGTPHQRGR